MPSLTIKNLPEPLHRALKARAAQHRRSLNNEVIHCLEQVISAVPLDPEAYLEHIRPLRQKTERLPLNDDRLQAAIETGRS